MEINELEVKFDGFTVQRSFSGNNLKFPMLNEDISGLAWTSELEKILRSCQHFMLLHFSHSEPYLWSMYELGVFWGFHAGKKKYKPRVFCLHGKNNHPDPIRRWQNILIDTSSVDEGKQSARYINRLLNEIFMHNDDYGSIEDDDRKNRKIEILDLLKSTEEYVSRTNCNKIVKCVRKGVCKTSSACNEKIVLSLTEDQVGDLQRDRRIPDDATVHPYHVGDLKALFNSDDKYVTWKFVKDKIKKSFKHDDTLEARKAFSDMMNELTLKLIDGEIPDSTTLPLFKKLRDNDRLLRPTITSMCMHYDVYAFGISFNKTPKDTRIQESNYKINLLLEALILARKLRWSWLTVYAEALKKPNCTAPDLASLL